MNPEFSPSVTCVTDVTHVTSVTMSDLNIRNLDASLVRELKIRAAQSEKTLRDYVIGVLWAAVGAKTRETEKIAENPEVGKVRQKRVRASETAEINTEVPALHTDARGEPSPSEETGRGDNDRNCKLAHCPKCGKRMSDWVTNWHCQSCGNFPK